LERGCYRSGRRGGFGDGVVDLIPDNRVVWIVGEGCIQERFDAVEVEVVGEDSRNEFLEIVSKGAKTCP